MMNTSVIVNNFNIAFLAVRPSETDPVLVVDADAVLTEPIALQHLQSIAWRRTEDVERSSGVQLGELASDYRFDPDEAANSASSENSLGIGMRERDNHRSTAYRLSISNHDRCHQALQSAPEAGF
jgi:hypothetical protein